MNVAIYVVIALVVLVVFSVVVVPVLSLVFGLVGFVINHFFAICLIAFAVWGFTKLAKASNNAA